MASTAKTAAVAGAVLLLIGLGAAAVLRSRDSGAVEIAEAPPSEPAPTAKATAGVERRTPRAPRSRAVETSPAPKEESASPKEQPAAAAETAAPRLARVKLCVDLKDDALGDVLVDLAERSGVEIVLSAEAAESPGAADAIERLELDHPVPAKQVLDLLTTFRGLRWTIEEPRVVIVVPGARRDPARPLVAPRRSSNGQPTVVSGRVTDPSGNPVPQAEIVQFHTQARLAVTGADGRFEFQVRRPYGSIEARADGVVSSSRSRVNAKPGEAVTVDLAVGGPAGTLTVRVVSDAGPAAGASVSVRAKPDSAAPRAPGTVGGADAVYTATCDETGTATLSGLPVGDVQVAATCPGLESAAVPAAVAFRSRTDVEVRLAAKTTLSQRLAQKRITFDFAGAAAAEVVAFINDGAGLSVVIDPALAPKLEGRGVTLAVRDEPVAEALRRLCEQIGGVELVVNDAADVVFIRAVKPR